MIPSRRALLSSGFALAVTPIASTVLATSADGLEAGEVKIPTSAGDIPAYRAYPKGDGKKKLPALLVVHEIFGVHEHIKDVCRRLAKLGYFAIAPELFVRQGDPSKIPEVKQLLRELVSKVPDAQVLADLDACVDWASHEARADVGRLGVTGFCWGGRITWLYAARRPSLKAGVAWYGKLVGERDPLHPTFPLDLVDQLKAPVLGLYGGLDQGIPLASIGQTRGALLTSKNAVANASQFHIYPEAGHAFAADYRPSYRKADAEDGFKRLHAWFKAHGAG